MSEQYFDKLQLEIMKLLIQLAWADHEITPAEVSHILEAARSADIDEANVAELERALDGEIPPPPPDFGFLRAHRKESLEAVARLVESGPGLADEEFEVFEQMRDLLAGD